jgi:hypothetical protein
MSHSTKHVFFSFYTNQICASSSPHVYTTSGRRLLLSSGVHSSSSSLFHLSHSSLCKSFAVNPTSPLKPPSLFAVINLSASSGDVVVFSGLPNGHCPFATVVPFTAIVLFAAVFGRFCYPVPC